MLRFVDKPDIHLGGHLTPKRLSIVVITALVTCLTAGFAASPAGASEASLTGAGSTLVAPLEGTWAIDFERRSGESVVYAPVGSGAGISQITARTVDFGASDAPLTPSQAEACKAGSSPAEECLEIPWALTATGIAFNIPGIRSLHLSGPVIAEIYLGKITNWDAPAIKKLNKGAKLPNLAITPVYRSDGSGDTYVFTNYLSDVSSQWKKEVSYATTVSFKTGVGGKGNAGVTAVVQSTSGSIGYISASYIIAHGLSAAAVENAAGKFEFPNLKNIEDAASAVQSVPANNELHIVDPSKKYKTAYPLSTFTYCIVPLGSPKKELLAKWIYYAMTLGQGFAPPLDFAPIPKVVLNAGIKSIRKLEAS
jgi:phosphate transport system substrate-binding protein